MPPSRLHPGLEILCLLTPDLIHFPEQEAQALNLDGIWENIMARVRSKNNSTQLFREDFIIVQMHGLAIRGDCPLEAVIRPRASVIDRTGARLSQPQPQNMNFS